MKKHLEQQLQTALASLQEAGVLLESQVFNILVERTRDRQHGDFASNIAMTLAKPAGLAPRALAEQIIKALPLSTFITKTEIAGPGFINFYLIEGAEQTVIAQILEQKNQFGHCNLGQGQRVHMEYVSANPTGPLHVGHGRGAAYGDSLANVLKAAGFKVHREYYVNDAGRQMDILAASVWLRYLELMGEKIIFPSNGYKGTYVPDIARDLQQQYKNRFVHPASVVFADLPLDLQADGSGDKEIYIDAVVDKAKILLGVEGYRIIHAAGLINILGDIRNDLEEFRVTYDEWFSERSLQENDALHQGVERLKASGHCYEQEGALWFRSTSFGDEKDRVVVRENGQPTYFASDVAYHLNKFNRGFDLVIDVLGADHHGYVPRLRALLEACGIDSQKLHAPLVQFAVLYRGHERVQMSTRSGSFVTLRELREEVGNDAARFFYVLRKAQQHMDFDLDLAKSESNDNPVYYIQYAHARVCSVLRQMTEKGFSFNETLGLQNLSLLKEPHEEVLVTTLNRYPEVLALASKLYEPHQVAHYLRDLANDFHTYYNAQQFLVDSADLRNARLCLVQAVKQVILNGLTLLGVSAPDTM